MKKTIGTIRVTEIVGMTYRQVDILMATSKHFKHHLIGAGKLREFTFRETVLLMVAKYMRKDKLNVTVIDQVLDAIIKNWKTDEPNEAGVITLWADGVYRWSAYAMALSTDEYVQTLDNYVRVPKIFYNIRQMAYEVDGAFYE